MKNIIITIAILGFSLTTFAQTSEEQAKQALIDAANNSGGASNSGSSSGITNSSTGGSGSGSGSGNANSRNSNTNNRAGSSGSGRMTQQDVNQHLERIRQQQGVNSCPFRSSSSEIDIMSNVISAISAIREDQQRQCPNMSTQVEALQSSVTAIRQNSSFEACQQYRQNQSEYNYITSNLSGHALGYIPPAYSICFNDTFRDPDQNCIRLVNNTINSRTARLCTSDRNRRIADVAEVQRTEALLNMANALNTALSNPNCSAGQVGDNLIQAGIDSLPLFASSIPGFGLPLAFAAQTLGALAQRLFSGGDDGGVRDGISRLDEQYQRCMYMQIMNAEFNCSADVAQQRPSTNVPSGLIAEISNLATYLSPATNSSGENSGRLSNADINDIMRSLDTEVTLPDRTTMTMRGIIESTLANLRTIENPTPTQQAQIRQMQLLIDLRSGQETELTRERDQISGLILNTLIENNPKVSDMIVEALVSRNEYAGLLNNQRDSPDSTMNKILIDYTRGLQDAFSARYNVSEITRLSSSVDNAITNNYREELINREMTNAFNICAYNGFTAISDQDTLNRYSRTIRSNRSETPDVAAAINPTSLNQFRTACSKYSCIFELPSNMGTPRGFRNWQCNIYNNQERMSSAFSDRLRQWQANNYAGTFCGTTTESGGESSSSNQ